VASARLVNVAVDVFEHGTDLAYGSKDAESVPFDLILLKAEGNGPLERVAVAPEAGSYLSGRRFYMRWTFNDVPVDPSIQSHFVVSVLPTSGEAASRHSTVWTHASDARTVQPVPTEPPACVPAGATASAP
jgi:hypothetical protein